MARRLDQAVRGDRERKMKSARAKEVKRGRQKKEGGLAEEFRVKGRVRRGRCLLF